MTIPRRRARTFACLMVLAFAGIGCASRSSSRTYLCAGDERYGAAQYDLAVIEYSEAVRSAVKQGRLGRGHLGRAYRSRGLALERMGEHKRAVGDYDKAVSLAFWDPEPYVRRAGGYCKLRQYDKAVADYTEAIRLRPDDGRLYCLRALAYKRLGQADRAESDVQMASCLMPGDDIAREIKAVIHAETTTASRERPRDVRHYAAGAPSPEPGQAAAEEWQFTLTPYVFAAGIKGSGTIGPIKAPVDMSAQDLIEIMDFSGALFFEAWKGRWGFLLAGSYVALSDKATLPGGLVTIDADIRIANVDAAVGYRLLDIYVGKGQDDREASKYPRVQVEPVAGMRYGYVKQELVVTPGPTLGGSHDWVEPLVGGRVKLIASERLRFICMGDISGFGVGSASDKTWNLWGIVQYRLSESVSLNAGYRVNSLKFSEGSGAGKVAADLKFSGPVIGVMFYF